MSSEKPPSSTVASDDSEIDGSCGTGTPPAGDPLKAWISLVDDWWHQHKETIPAEFRHTMEATLQQSRAMVALAADLSEATPERGDDRGSEPAPAGPAVELWQPVLEAFRACEASILRQPDALTSSEDYAAAAGAYFGEFARLNVEVTRRLQENLAHVDEQAGFVDLHRRLLREAEEAYLAHVSTDSFARSQAEFINALLRRARSSQADDSASPDKGKA